MARSKFVLPALFMEERVMRGIGPIFFMGPQIPHWQILHRPTGLVVVIERKRADARLKFAIAYAVLSPQAWETTDPDLLRPMFHDAVKRKGATP